ncbi:MULTISPECIES: tryptophan synthase subunit alpha [Sporosarcina]|uniref:Tryptophan synthase alpha chain n=2 Tax=Sporosarcina newyorkensis TaxID=759851 RepID=A0A1T4YW51_9BACL|nr:MULTISPECIES: tryptophan synthase subunit alpha [Sporosarcina]EGQ24646.1 tryptophan synthase alpha subunit [Sporosarcina newyorkensis 2681]MBY0222841.1 tryptophan synthase subunit alpha [Sporosarcina aquimarina]SKB06019.1 tryptophan synthase, alpha chain [Sporosarcina newyorkensis]
MTKQKVMQAILQCNERGDKAFVPYIMAGDGGLQTLKKNILFLQEAGAAAIEVGIPFSDPVADGEVIQQAGERALTEGVTLRKVMAELASFKEEVTVPLVIMTYLNPILSYGLQAMAADCENSGVYGLIVPDLPLEESGLLKSALEGTDIALIQLVSLTSPAERINAIAEAAEGFIYAVTVNGITGVRDSFTEGLEDHLERLKAASSVPVLAGFGISTPEHVRSLGALADGVIVGSAIVSAFHEGDLPTIRTLIDASKNQVSQI